mgnify:CR=1 FL=1
MTKRGGVAIRNSPAFAGVCLHQALEFEQLLVEMVDGRLALGVLRHILLFGDVHIRLLGRVIDRTAITTVLSSRQKAADNNGVELKTESCRKQARRTDCESRRR